MIDSAHVTSAMRKRPSVLGKSIARTEDLRQKEKIDLDPEVCGMGRRVCFLQTGTGLLVNMYACKLPIWKSWVIACFLWTSKFASPEGRHI